MIFLQKFYDIHRFQISNFSRHDQKRFKFPEVFKPVFKSGVLSLIIRASFSNKIDQLLLFSGRVYTGLIIHKSMIGNPWALAGLAFLGRIFSYTSSNISLFDTNLRKKDCKDFIRVIVGSNSNNLNFFLSTKKKC